jgi:hypothetical protein
MEGQLKYNYITDRFELNGQELHCGNALEVLIEDGVSGKPEWVWTRIEHNDTGWYLVGLRSYQIDGLFARV